MRMRLKGKQLEVTVSKPPRVGQKVDPLSLPLLTSDRPQPLFCRRRKLSARAIGRTNDIDVSWQEQNDT